LQEGVFSPVCPFLLYTFVLHVNWAETIVNRLFECTKYRFLFV